ncbi:MAG: helix-turn-helix transcriptional regulator [Negativicutes bacterium]
MAKGLSQKELAKLVGTQQSAVSRYEKEDCFQMSIRQLNKVAHALGKKVEIRLCD